MVKISLGVIILLMLLGCQDYEIRLIKTFLVSDIFKKNNYNPISYEGYAFDALINGVPVIEISNKDKIASLKGYRDISSVHWQLLHPIEANSTLSINIKKRRIKEHDIGKLDPTSYEVVYHALSDVKIEETIVMKEDKSILIGGSPLMVCQHIVNRLPVGEYVLSITAYGTENWDRKEIFVKVEEKSDVSKFL